MFLSLLAAAVLTACGGGDDDDRNLPEETRPQDSRSFAPADPTATTFDALTAAPGDAVDNATTSRWAGVLDDAAYRIEVPANWNGKLVMYAHGYAGTGSALAITNPSIRRHLIQNGYAWAASSYTKKTPTRWRWRSTASPTPAAGRWRRRSASTSSATPWAATSRRRPSRRRRSPRPTTGSGTTAPCPCAA
jgi:hypothetical protein